MLNIDQSSLNPSLIPHTPSTCLQGRGAGAAGREASNSNAGNLRLLRAVICAGLYPNLVRVERPDTKYAEGVAGAIAQAATAKDLRMFTQGDGRVFLHPSSVNFRQGDFASPWLVYHTKRATSKIFIQDSSMVTPFAVSNTIQRGRGRVGRAERG